MHGLTHSRGRGPLWRSSTRQAFYPSELSWQFVKVYSRKVKYILQKNSINPQATKSQISYILAINMYICTFPSFLSFWQVTLCNPGWPRTQYIDQASLELTRCTYLPLPPSSGIKSMGHYSQHCLCLFSRKAKVCFNELLHGYVVLL